jgi:hypothetical protein
VFWTELEKYWSCNDKTGVNHNDPYSQFKFTYLMEPIIFTYSENKGQELEAPECDQQVLEDLGTGPDQQL